MKWLYELKYRYTVVPIPYDIGLREELVRLDHINPYTDAKPLLEARGAVLPITFDLLTVLEDRHAFINMVNC